MKLGQQWRDRDKRMAGRTVTITAVDGVYAYYDRGPNRKAGRIAIGRMHSKTTGFEQVKQPLG